MCALVQQPFPRKEKRNTLILTHTHMYNLAQIFSLYLYSYYCYCCYYDFSSCSTHLFRYCVCALCAMRANVLRFLCAYVWIWFGICINVLIWDFALLYVENQASLYEGANEWVSENLLWNRWYFGACVCVCLYIFSFGLFSLFAVFHFLFIYRTAQQHESQPRQLNCYWMIKINVCLCHPLSFIHFPSTRFSFLRANFLPLYPIEEEKN